jgi:hypothetical protein
MTSILVILVKRSVLVLIVLLVVSIKLLFVKPRDILLQTRPSESLGSNISWL